MKCKNKFTPWLWQLVIILIAIFSIIYGIGGTYNAYAAPSGVSEFEEQTVLEDLNGATVNGKTFSIFEYQPNKIKNLELLTFLEFGYYSETKSNYNLYFYIYNPQEIDLNLSSPLNQIEFRVGGNTAEQYSKYDVQLLNASGVLYKYKVILNATQRTHILSSLNEDSRIYEVAGIELLQSGALNAEDHKVAKKYTYTGEGESLSCTSEGTITLTLDVRAANYRAEGSNGTNNYTQDTLHSVYFSVPDKIIEEYGDISAVHARWLNATTAPMLVISNDTWSDPYSEISSVNFSGQTWYDIFYNNALEYYGNTEANPYLLFTNLRKVDFGTPSKVAGVQYDCDYAYNIDRYIPDSWCTYELRNINKGTLNYLPIVLKATGNALKYTVSTDELINYFKSYVKDACDGIGDVAGKYSDWCFSKFDRTFTEMNIQSDETFKLTSQKIGQHFWEKAFGWEGTNTITNEEFEVQAIQKIERSDIKSSAADTSKNLLIGEWDVASFTNYFNTARAKTERESTYLFRYYKSEYFSQAAQIMNRGNSQALNLGHYDLETVYDNAYMAQEEVQLDFDIIDITFTKGDVKTVIGIVSTPLDNFAPITPPLDYYENDFWKYACIIIAVLVVLLVVDLFVTKHTNTLQEANNMPPDTHYKKE